jgi:predicted dienelactone hydrolase
MQDACGRKGLRRSWMAAAATAAWAAASFALPACASVGLARIAATEVDGPVTVFYASSAPAAPVRRGPFTFSLAEDGVPVRGNGRLVVVSHGSGGSPWVHAELAQALVDAGFVVAFPEHRGDSTRDPSHPGPDSWTIRPKEVVRAIDAVGADPRFAPLLALDRVGMYGMSAGGHTALSLAGGRWSPARFARHCDADLEADFQSCVGLITRLSGGPLDPLKRVVARAVIQYRFAGDDRPRVDGDPRIAAIVAGVPSAADFDMGSLAAPRVPLGLVTARQDRWLVPRFHSDRVLEVCKSCERVAEFPDGGHGALLGPAPPTLGGLVGELLNDPPGFDRAREVPAVDARIVAFFRRHLLAGD